MGRKEYFASGNLRAGGKTTTAGGCGHVPDRGVLGFIKVFGGHANFFLGLREQDWDLHSDQSPTEQPTSMVLFIGVPGDLTRDPSLENHPCACTVAYISSGRRKRPNSTKPRGLLRLSTGKQHTIIYREKGLGLWGVGCGLLGFRDYGE